MTTDRPTPPDLGSRTRGPGGAGSATDGPAGRDGSAGPAGTGADDPAGTDGPAGADRPAGTGTNGPADTHGSGGIDVTVGVVGGGTMGVGIAHALLTAGYAVILVEVDGDTARAAAARVAGSLERAVARGRLPEGAVPPLTHRLGTTAEPAELAAAGLVIEAVPEQLSLKRAVLAKLTGPGGPVPATAVVATNTSSLAIDALADAVTRPERFAGAHFFNPVPASSLVEVVRGTATASATLASLHALATALDKESIEVADSPGFATSRLGLALGLEAIRMVEDGVASADDIDRALVLGYRHPVGPLRLTDLVGLDVRLGIADYLATELGARFAPPALLREKVARGELGRKSGRGFYDWGSPTSGGGSP